MILCGPIIYPVVLLTSSSTSHRYFFTLNASENPAAKQTRSPELAWTQLQSQHALFRLDVLFTVLQHGEVSASRTTTTPTLKVFTRGYFLCSAVAQPTTGEYRPDLTGTGL